MKSIIREIKSKLVTRSLQSCNFDLSSRVASSTSAQILPYSSSSSSPAAEHSPLWKRLQNVTDSVVPVLDRWIKEGNTVGKPLIRSLIWLLQRDHRYHHALEVSHWMTNSQSLTLSRSDAATRASLFQRTSRLEDAKACFNNLSKNLKTYDDYVTLLCCYVQENSVENAEVLMQKMRRKKMLNSPHPYNLLSKLYARNGDIDKTKILIQEMKGNGISPDKYTMSNLLAACVAASDISGMEKVLDQMEKDPNLVQGWRTYSIAANGFLKAGLIKQALTMLRKMEETMSLGMNTILLGDLLTQNAKTGRKDEVYRVWNTYKLLVELDYKVFCCMISSLVELEDIEGAETIFEEWESRSTTYDFRVLNSLLIGYCKKGLFEKAEAAVEKAAGRRTPCASTWNILARGYVERNEIPKAVEMFMRALSVSTKGWKPKPIMLNACFDYLELQGDVKGMEEVIKLLKSLELSTTDMYRRLVRTCIATEKVEDLDRSLMEDFSADEEVNKILRVA
ncbi:Tetratricopeptide repeat (TPR)-like superfamily protein [Euphorbia peplus]|nr:Tetratricopeptide repeat (TPR)-like superfamily protein [Euphorbia peplus]